MHIVIFYRILLEIRDRANVVHLKSIYSIRFLMYILIAFGVKMRLIYLCFKDLHIKMCKTQ